MSLTVMNLFDVVKRQYQFKMKAFYGSFGSLVLMQIIGLVFSLGGSGGYGSSSDVMTLSIRYYTADTVIIFTFIWSFITAILITTRATRYDDFSFVGNRLSSNLANIAFLITVNLIAGTSALMSGYIVRLVAYFAMDVKLGGGIVDAPGHFLLAVLATALYGILCSAAGYFIGVLVQWHKGFLVIVPVVLMGGFIGFFSVASGSVAEQFYAFLFLEHSFPIFAMKTIVISTVVYGLAVFSGNRLEVRGS